MTFANGNRSLAICDRCGQQYKYLQLRKEWNGLFTCPECFEPKHPQLDPRFHPADPNAESTGPPTLTITGSCLAGLGSLSAIGSAG